MSDDDHDGDDDDDDNHQKHLVKFMNPDNICNRIRSKKILFGPSVMIDNNDDGDNGC